MPLLLMAVALAMFVITALDRVDADETGVDETPAIGSGEAVRDDTAEGEEATGADDAEAGSSDIADEADEAEEADAAGEDGSGEPLVVGAAPLPEPPTDAPFVDATLTDNIFVLSGVVPDEASKAALEGRAALAYAPFHSSELQVDESVGTAEWLASAPSVVGLLPMITDGTIRLQDDAVILAGRSPSQVNAELFAGTVGSVMGLPVTADAIAVTGLVPPRFVATVADGQVTLDGEIPNQQLLETFILGAAAVYGEENVTSTMTVDEGTYTSFWNYTMPGVFAQLQPFPNYEVRVENAVTSGSMQGAILFDLNSAEISPQATEILPIGIALLARDLSLSMTVIGHTDSLGSDEINERLSLQRAQSVVDFFIANGIDESRLSAEGKGSSDPLADNSSAEGRALNRRVEFVFG